MISSSKNFEEFLKDISFLNIQPVNYGQNNLCYGVLNSRSNDRYWLLPLCNYRLTQSGLEMFQPLSKTAKISRKLIEFAIKYNINDFWISDKIYMSGLPKVDVNFNQPIKECAYFTGTAGPHRKTSIQFMSDSGLILGYAKLTRNSTIANFISAEAKMLDELSNLKIKSACFPKKLSYSSTDKGVTLIVTDTRRSGEAKSPISFICEHKNFLIELSYINRDIGNQDEINKLTFFISQVLISLNDKFWIQRLTHGINLIRKQNQKLQLCLNHGDFTPWNVFIDSGGLYVFDWEYSNKSYPLGYDFARFILSLPKKMNVNEINNYIINMSSEFFFNNNKKSAAINYFTSLILFSTFYLSRESDCNSTQWEDSLYYGKLIDSCRDIIDTLKI